MIDDAATSTAGLKLIFEKTFQVRIFYFHVFVLTYVCINCFVALN